MKAKQVLVRLRARAQELATGRGVHPRDVRFPARVVDSMQLMPEEVLALLQYVMKQSDETVEAS